MGRELEQALELENGPDASSAGIGTARGRLSELRRRLGALQLPTLATGVAGQSAAMAAASLTSLWPLLEERGWPANHESTVWATRLAVLLDAWHRGELMPLWWSEGNSGLGSPMPGLYHKLQNFVCAALLAVVGDVRLAAILSLLLFTIIGCAGVRKVALQLGASPWTATLHALLLPFASYVSADWLVRGAFAEHAAFMLLPWLVSALLELIEHGRVRVGLLSATMIALFYAHSISALFSVGLIAIAALLALARHPRRSAHILGKGMLSAAYFGLAVAPMAWVMSVLSRPFYLEHATSGYYDVQGNLTDLYNAMFVGSAPVISFWVAPDQELRWAIAAAAVLAAIPPVRARTARRWLDPALVFLIASGALMTFLRLQAASAVYEHVPGLRYIQFPWRLLSFITVLAIALSAALFGRIRERVATPLAAIVLVVLAARSRVLHFNELRETEEHLAESFDPRHYVKWWEYVPAIPYAASDEQLGEWAQGAVSLSPSCSVHSEGCARCFLAECTTPGTIALPYAFSGLELVTDGAGHGVPIFRDQDDARVLVPVGAGRTMLRYRRPSWGTLIRRWRLAR